MDAPVVVITGANSGIGKAAAIQFAARGWHVVMACRDVGRSEPARRDVCEEAESPKVDLLELDLASLESVRQFAGEFRSQFSRLDALIHNAGFFNHGVSTYQFSPDGVEQTFAVNTFAPYLLNKLLRGPLAATNGCILYASSTSIKYFLDAKRTIAFDNLRGEFAASRPYDSYRMYADSKMGQLLLMFASEADFAADHIRTNVLMIPATKLTPDRIAKLPPRYRLLARLQQPISHEVRYMASRYVEICTAPDLERLHGVVFNHTLRQLRRPASNQTLSPLEVLRTRHIPVYAVQGAHQVRMREIAEQVCR